MRLRQNFVADMILIVKTGKGYFRLTSFNSKEKTVEEVERIKQLLR